MRGDTVYYAGEAVGPLDDSTRKNAMGDDKECELKTDKDRLDYLYDKLLDLISLCTEHKNKIKALGNWKIAHELDSQLCLAFEVLKRRLEEKEI